MFLAAAASALLAASALAAPAGRTVQAPAVDRYLPDDADGVLLVNVRQVLASPAYKKGFQKDLAGLLSRPEAQPFLKDAGFDPLKDVERLIVCNSKSCWRDAAGGKDEGPFFLFEGKFDAAKLKAKAAALAKDHAEKVKVLDGPGGAKIYRIDPNGSGPYVAVLDSRTVVLAGQKAHVLDALAKASGKKATRFAHKEVAAQLKKLDPKAAVQGFAVAAFVGGLGVGRAVGPGGAPVPTPTLGDQGFTLATLTITIKDDARGAVVLHAKDKDKAAKTAASAKEGLTLGRAQMAQMAGAGGPAGEVFKHVARFMDAVTIKSAGQTVTFEARTDAETLRGLIVGTYLAGN
jgi:hypothetical protein